MKKNQVCIADDPRTHTTKFVDTKDLFIDDKHTLGEVIGTLVQEVEKLKAENEHLKKATRDTVKVVALVNNK